MIKKNISDRLTLFDLSNEFIVKSDSQNKSYYCLYVDGASRGNPGPAGAGIFVIKNGIELIKEGFFLGDKTNNEAEYLALLLGIYCLKEYYVAGDCVVIRSDSQLMVRQMIGQYRVRERHLMLLYNAAHIILAGVDYKFEHVLRQYNTRADELANVGVDKKKMVPIKFINCLREYEIII